jgi:hypothetical protein
LGVTADAIEQTLTRWLCGGGPAGKIDPEALAALGIDFEAVRERLEQTFGLGALEQTRSACLGIAPRLKLALAYAVDLAAGEPLLDEHVLHGILRVPESVAARARRAWRDVRCSPHHRLRPPRLKIHVAAIVGSRQSRSISNSSISLQPANALVRAGSGDATR